MKTTSPNGWQFKPTLITAQKEIDDLIRDFCMEDYGEDETLENCYSVATSWDDYEHLFFFQRKNGTFWTVFERDTMEVKTMADAEAWFKSLLGHECGGCGCSNGEHLSYCTGGAHA